MPSHPLLDAALTAADHGWPVFLLGRTKRPLANCPHCPKKDHPDAHDPQTCGHLTCHGFYAATRDPDRLTAMLTEHPYGLLAVRTGVAPAGAGIVTIDIDPAHGGRLHPDLMTPTRAVRTGSNGWHLHYQHPGPPALSRPLPGYAGVDVKADGGYCVLPPSRHPDTGRPYRWANTRPVEEMPPHLAQIVYSPPTGTGADRSPAPPPARPSGPTTQDPVACPAKLVDACLAAVHRAPEGRRRVTLYGAARGVARAVHAGYDAAIALALLTDAGRAADQTDRDIHAAITAGFAAEGLQA